MKVVRFKMQSYVSSGAYIYPFKNDEILLNLGEIENMPGHCAVVNKDGRIFWGYHVEDFIEIED